MHHARKDPPLSPFSKKLRRTYTLKNICEYCVNMIIFDNNPLRQERTKDDLLLSPLHTIRGKAKINTRVKISDT